jgi:hypothetical protein
MLGFNGALPVSFMDLEVCLFEKLAELFRVEMGRLLEALDALLYEVRDRERYKVEEIADTRIETLFGTVEFRRRVYGDCETGERVYGLDEALGLQKRARVSPGLRHVAVLQAVDGPSYRGARDNLKEFYGHQVLSHESIRRYVLEVGKQIEGEIRRRRDNPVGDRKVKVLFIEADGIWVSRQRAGKKEARLAIAHEGWRRRSGAGEEYELVHRTHCYVDDSREDFWEEASRQLWSIYDLRDTVVVINGDRAGWVRRGVGYFPKAMYQFDRFHLKRELKVLLRDVPEACGAVLKGLEENRPEAVLATLREVQLKDLGARRALADLRRELERNEEAMVDYRVRLKALGYDTTGMRGLGAAESNINKFSRRLKKQGRSWGKRGLAAMIHTMAKRFEGTLGIFTRRFDEALDEVRTVFEGERLTAGAGRVVREMVSEVACAATARMPVLGAGRNSSGGLSWYFQRLNDALPAGLS